ncbi:hypothetical protein A9K55_006524 [Cordyceps militaris]|uniref:Uncharacterized protein n=1 Tax=Cordyceps militaris TaxID=73501 RepID=A0A2H4SB76_CORMI|nr:hypothetical protein A9K55_006524 [Cordyceps militaris]
MGTRHLVVVILNGIWYIAQYGQWDGYPEVVGMQLVRLLARPDLVRDLRAGLPHTYEPDEATVQRLEADAAEPLQILNHVEARLDHNGELRFSDYQEWRRDPLARWAPELLDMLPSLHRDTSAAVLVLVARGASAERPLPIHRQPEFANDGLFCEWAYVVDLDTDVLEVYEGAAAKTPGHRFAHVGPDSATVPVLVLSLPFDKLDEYKNDRNAFVARINHEIDGINKRNAAARKELDE